MMMPNSDTKALDFATRAHEGQYRIGGKRPYITHPIQARDLLLQHGHTNSNFLSAALLHDVLEDTKVTADEMRAVFGDDITNIVCELTDDPNMGRRASKERLIRNGKNLSVGAKVVKAADRLANLSDILEHEPETWHKGAVQGYTRSSLKLVEAIKCPENTTLCESVVDMAQRIFDKYGE